jgi:hypothetical protein
MKPTNEGGFHWSSDKDAARHLSARDGDHLVTPFQCNVCVFRSLKGRNPDVQDGLLLACIRQANLDAFWGREIATVSSTLCTTHHTIKQLQRVQLPPPFPPLGPLPVQDTFGYLVAIAMLLKSLEPGRYATTKQYETIRKLRAGASVPGLASLRVTGGQT